MKQILTFDSTQINAFLECPRIWYYSYVLSIEPIFYGEKDAMNMGSLGHIYLERYYKELAKGSNINQAYEYALNVDIDDVCKHCKHPKADHIYDNLCVSCDTTKNVHQFEHTEFPLGKIERDLVKNQIRLYTFTYAAHDFIIDNPEKVEVGFDHVFHEDENYIYAISGRIDVFNPKMRDGTQLGYVDHKFQMRKRDLYKKSIQFKNYALVTDSRMNMVNYIRFAKTITQDTFSRELITFTSMALEAWKWRLIDVYQRMAKALSNAEHIEDYWQTMASQPNWSMCSGKYGYPCTFTSICESDSHTEALIKIDNQYKHKEHWVPW